MNTYTHRARVISAFNHKEPDRVPIDLMGQASMLFDKTYFKLRDYLGLSPIEPIRSGTTSNYYDERILEYLDIDFRRIFLKKKRSQKKIHDKGFYTDEWGIQYRKTGPYYHIVNHPMENFTTIDEVENYNWPKAQDLFTVDGLKRKAKDMYEKTDYALVARNPVTTGFLDKASFLMGMSGFFMSMAINPSLAHCIINNLLRIYKDIYSLFLDEVGPYVQMVETGDDLGTQENLLISPEMYREFIKPADKELFALIHKKAPNSKLFKHSDGAIFEIIPDLIEIGVSVLNPVQISARGMNAQRLKELFGNKISFHGSLENMEISLDSAVKELKERIDTLSPNGGFVVSTCNHLIDVAPESIITVFDTAKEYGKY